MHTIRGRSDSQGKEEMTSVIDQEDRIRLGLLGEGEPLIAGLNRERRSGRISSILD